jgi:hypothetical protein
MLKQELKGDEAILIKGSRAQRMENVVAALVRKLQEINNVTLFCRII